MHKLNYGSSIIIELCAELGEEVADKVAREFAGRRVFIPPKGTEKHRLLCERFGRPAADWLAETAASVDIDFPSLRSIQQRQRLLARAVDLANPAMSANEIAHKHGITRRWAVILRRQYHEENPAPCLPRNDK